MQQKIEIVIAIVSASLFIFLIVLTAFLLFRIYLKKKNRLLFEQERMKVTFEQVLLLSQMEIQEQTLKNISQEIHDNIGQTLSLAKLNLNTIDLQKQNAQDKIVGSKELVSKAIHDLRNLSRSLNTDSILSSGLVKAIETELSIIQHAGLFKTAFSTSGTANRIDPKKELILFRIVQEAINNIIKHSGANSILVSLNFTDNELKIEVSDDGNGFDAAAASAEGQGLRNMKSRAELIGGSFQIQSASNETTITVTLPTTAS